MKPEILEQKPVTIAEVKETLKKIQKRDEELTFRGGKTLDHVNEVPTITITKTKELFKKIEELDIPRLKDIQIVKIIDTMPESAEHLKVILSGYNVTIIKENMQKIIDVVDEYRPIKK
jgi:DNA-directed RNA polymerase subunit F